MADVVLLPHLHKAISRCVQCFGLIQESNPAFVSLVTTERLRTNFCQYPLKNQCGRELAKYGMVNRGVKH